MVGGIVIETVTLKDRIWVNCVDEAENRNGKCAIYVKRNPESERIKPGDGVWWQGGSAMWNPYGRTKQSSAGGKSGIDYDIRIPRIGFSGVFRPQT